MQVQNTNDSSIVSKLSSSNMGYFDDNCLKMFVAKGQRRSPIINRGYYIRFKALEAVFKSWFTSFDYVKTQVVSLGAGFDSSYFRMKKHNQLPIECKYIEIDYPEVMKRKLECIQKSEFQNLMSKDSIKNVNVVASYEGYVMLGIDLKQTEDIEKCLKDLGIVCSIPTIFLSECAVTYMDVKSSNNLIQWIQSRFENSAFVTYEQVYPEDGFGIVMQNHFKSLNCPLKSLKSYPDKGSQISRYLKAGWKLSSAVSMFDFFLQFPDEEKRRIQKLELFDEYEMWHEKCHHYTLIWACQGIVTMPQLFHIENSMDDNRTNFQSKIDWKLESVPESMQRFGHQVALLSSRFLVISGGFGQLNRKHQRLDGLVCFDHLLKICYPVSLTDPSGVLGKRMFHSMTRLFNNSLVVLGGRSSPNHVYDKVLHITQENLPVTTQDSVKLPSHSCNNTPKIEVSFSVMEKSSMPEPTWRHSACSVHIDGTENILVFGGCTSKETATNNSYILNTETFAWCVVQPQVHTPSPRHSHSCVNYCENEAIITCGLSQNETILNSVHIFNGQELKWTTLTIAGLIPRYSHTSHIWNDRLFLVGGITSISGFSLSVGIVCLKTLTAVEFSAPAQNPEFPILLSNHCSYIDNDKIFITGGGGNCFSFGTHFNTQNVLIDIKKLI